MTAGEKLALGADAGTHGVRILAVRLADGTVAARSGSGYRRETGGGVQELDMAAVERAFREALAALRLPPEAAVAGLAVTHQRGTVVPVDGACRPLANALCDSDERAADAGGFRAAGLDPADYYDRTGCPVVSFNGFAKILWCRAHRPALAGAAAWLSPQDYLLSRLLGRVQLSAGSALRSGFLDVGSRCVARELLPDAPFLRAPCAPVGTVCGTVSDEWAERFPFLRGVPLVAAPGDQPAAVLGAGAMRDGLFAMNLGTTFVASAARTERPRDPKRLITTEILPFGRYAPEFGTGAGGQFMDFLTALLLSGETLGADGWAALGREAASVPAGAEGLRVVPLLWQVTSAGVEGRITGLRPFHTRAHFLRAAFEGLAMEARLSADYLASRTARPERLRVFGGLSGCGAFLDILADVLGMPVEEAGETQASALGAALTCAAALGVCPDPESLGRLAPPVKSVHKPRGEESEFYESAYEKYRAGR